MLVILIGDNAKKRQEVKDKNSKYLGHVNLFLKGEDIFGLKQYFGQDIFVDILKVKLEDWNKEDLRSFLYKYLEEIRDSKNIFIIDEYDILDSTLKKISNFAEKVFDIREVAEKDSAFYLADLILKKDKRGAWLEYVRLKKVGEPIESIIGAINYKLRFARDVDREKVFGGNLLSLAKDHDSLGDAEIDLEKLILGL